MTKQTREQFCEEMESRARDLEIQKAKVASIMGWAAPEPRTKNEESLEDDSDWSQPEQWDVWLVDYVEMTCETVYCNIAIEDANDFKSVWKDTKSQVVTLPSGFEIVNREWRARKLGEVASLLLDLSFGNTEDDEESSRICTAFHEGVANGHVEQ